jgi:type IV pilus assembly protein PilA
MMQKLLRKKSGFTLIELMIVVVIIGILAAVAIPAFIRFIKRSKTAEAGSLLGSLYTGAQTYYNREALTNRGLTAVTMQTACTVTGDTTTFSAPSAVKQAVTIPITSSFAALGFAPSGPTYYQYQIATTSAGCNNGPSLPQYSFTALGDLDGDAALATFEMAIGSDAENSLYHGAGLYIIDELE